MVPGERIPATSLHLARERQVKQRKGFQGTLLVGSPRATLGRGRAAPLLAKLALQSMHYEIREKIPYEREQRRIS